MKKANENVSFEVSPKGVFASIDGELVKVCSELVVHGAQGDKVLLEWKDPDKRTHHLVVKKEKIEKNFKPIFLELVNCGLNVIYGSKFKKLLKQYILQSNPDVSMYCVERAGWFGNSFVLPGRIIGAKEDEEKLFFQRSSPNDPLFAQQGSLDGWQQHVARLAQANSRFAFAISTALAGPILKFSGQPSGGFNINGSSSSGKTTALLVAASVWGDPDKYMRIWWSTKEGLEQLAYLHNDCLLIL